MIENGIIVHLHALKIVKNRDYLDSENMDNIYTRMQMSGRLFIEKPLDLNSYFESYRILKRYDAGVLHADEMTGRDDVDEFEKINIPNRIYEYEISGVQPLVKKDLYDWVEKHIQEKSFGIIYDDYKDLKNKLYQLIKYNKKIEILSESFRDFSKEIIDEMQQTCVKG